MRKNIGTFDRLLRAGIGLVLLAISWWQSSWILLGVALFTFFEALASWCLFYQILGKNSCPIDESK